MRIALRIAGIVALSAHAASATIIPFTATLSGANETSPNASPAIGVGGFVMDTDTNTLGYSIVYSGLVAAETAAHIHGFQPQGQNAPVVHTLPATAGLKVGVWIYPEANEADIIAGLAYVNVHSSTFSAGEIRGQILRTDVPVNPKTWTEVKGLYSPDR